MVANNSAEFNSKDDHSEKKKKIKFRNTKNKVQSSKFKLIKCFCEEMKGYFELTKTKQNKTKQNKTKHAS